MTTGKTIALSRQTLFSCAPKSLQMVTAALKLKRRLLLGRKAMTNLDSILKKQRHYFADKVPSVKTVFPVVMYECASSTIKKAEHQRIDCVREDSSESLGLQGDPTNPS